MANSAVRELKASFNWLSVLSFKLSQLTIRLLSWIYCSTVPYLQNVLLSNLDKTGYSGLKINERSYVKQDSGRRVV